LIFQNIAVHIFST